MNNHTLSDEIKDKANIFANLFGARHFTKITNSINSQEAKIKKIKHGLETLQSDLNYIRELNHGGHQPLLLDAHERNGLHGK